MPALSHRMQQGLSCRLDRHLLESEYLGLYRLLRKPSSLFDFVFNSRKQLARMGKDGAKTVEDTDPFLTPLGSLMRPSWPSFEPSSPRSIILRIRNKHGVRYINEKHT